MKEEALDSKVLKGIGENGEKVYQALEASIYISNKHLLFSNTKIESAIQFESLIRKPRGNTQITRVEFDEIKAIFFTENTCNIHAKLIRSDKTIKKKFGFRNQDDLDLFKNHLTSLPHESKWSKESRFKSLVKHPGTSIAVFGILLLILVFLDVDLENVKGRRTGYTRMIGILVDSIGKLSSILLSALIALAGIFYVWKKPRQAKDVFVYYSFSKPK